MLQKVLKLIYVAQKFAQTSVFLLNEAQNWKIQGILEINSTLLNKLKEFSEKTQGIFGKTQGIFLKNSLVTFAEKRKKKPAAGDKKKH